MSEWNIGHEQPPPRPTPFELGRQFRAALQPGLDDLVRSMPPVTEEDFRWLRDHTLNQFPDRPAISAGSSSFAVLGPSIFSRWAYPNGFIIDDMEAEALSRHYPRVGLYDLAVSEARRLGILDDVEIVTEPIQGGFMTSVRFRPARVIAPRND